MAIGARVLATFAASGAAAAAFVLPVGCLEPTQITLELSTDAECNDLDDIQIVLGPLEELRGRAPATETAACDERGRIGSLVLVPGRSAGQQVAFEVVVGVEQPTENCAANAYSGGCIVARRALSFIPNKTLTLPVQLELSCLDVPCGTTQSCRSGVCVSASVRNPSDCALPGGCSAFQGAGGSGGTIDAGNSGGTLDAGNSVGIGDAGLVESPQNAGLDSGVGRDASTDDASTSHLVVVTTVLDTLDGDTSSIDALNASPGPDSAISLREALTACNNTPNAAGPDVVHFDFPGVGPYSMVVFPPTLPDLDEPIVIDGRSAPEHGLVPNVEVVGTSAGSGNGLTLVAGSDGSEIYGLAINGFANDGLNAQDSGGHTIQGNDFGLQLDGSTAR